MTLALAWVLLAMLSLYVFARGRNFRRGRNRSWMALYRSPNLPIVVRNLPLVADLLSGLTLIWLMLAAAIAVALRFSALANPTHLAISVLAVASLALGFLILVLHRPPKRLTPKWLVEDDVRAGYVPAPGGGGDAVTVIIGLGFLAGGLLLIYGVLFVPTAF